VREKLDGAVGGELVDQALGVLAGGGQVGDGMAVEPFQVVGIARVACVVLAQVLQDGGTLGLDERARGPPLAAR
jgi:hypothetical protein